MGEIIAFICTCLLVFLVGFYIGKIVSKEKTVGTLIIDHESIPEEDPYLFLQTRVNPRTLIDKKTVMLDVSIEKFISQE